MLQLRLTVEDLETSWHQTSADLMKMEQSDDLLEVSDFWKFGKIR